MIRDIYDYIRYRWRARRIRRAIRSAKRTSQHVPIPGGICLMCGLPPDRAVQRRMATHEGDIMTETESRWENDPITDLLSWLFAKKYELEVALSEARDRGPQDHECQFKKMAEHRGDVIEEVREALWGDRMPDDYAAEGRMTEAVRELWDNSILWRKQAQDLELQLREIQEVVESAGYFSSPSLLPAVTEMAKWAHAHEQGCKVLRDRLADLDRQSGPLARDSRILESLVKKLEGLDDCEDDIILKPRWILDWIGYQVDPEQEGPTYLDRLASDSAW